MIYITVFSLSTLCFALSENKKLHNRALKWTLVIVGLLFPAVLAGLRNGDIGVDVQTYVVSSYQKARTYPFWTYLHFYKISDSYNGALIYDQLFYILVFLCSRICYDYHFGLFVYNFITILFWYLGLSRCVKLYHMDRMSIALGMLAFYLLLYNPSLCYIRMMIALSLVFYAVTFLLEDKYWPYVIWSVIAFFFHSSTLLSAGIFVLYVFFKRKQNDRIGKDLLKIGISLLGVVAVLLCSKMLVTALVDVGILRENYLEYFSGGAYSESSQFYTISSLMIAIGESIFTFKVNQMFCLCVAAVVCYPYIRKMNHSTLFLLSCALFNFIAALTSIITDDLIRICYYFIPLILVDYLLVLEQLKHDQRLFFRIGSGETLLVLEPVKRDQRETFFVVMVIGFIALEVFWWWFDYGYTGALSTVPYEFYPNFKEDYEWWKWTISQTGTLV